MCSNKSMIGASKRVMRGCAAAVLVVMAGSAGAVYADAGAKPADSGASTQGEKVPPAAIKLPTFREPGAPVSGAEVASGPVLGAPAPVVSEAPGIAAARERVKAQREAAARQRAAREALEKAKASETSEAIGLTGQPPVRDPLAPASPASKQATEGVAVSHSGVGGVSGGARLVVRDGKDAAGMRAMDEQRLAKLAKWIDADASGVIEPAEWRALHPGLGDFDREFEQRYVRANGSLRARALADWDTDGDGEVSDLERDAARKMWERSRLLIVSGFDKDGDAKLDLMELRAFEGSLGGMRMARGGQPAGNVTAAGASSESGPRLSQYRITTTRVATIVSTLDQE